MRKVFVKQIDSTPEAPAELVSLSHGSALIGANKSCTLCGATPAVIKARYKNPLGNIDYTHIFCDNCADKYGVGQSGTVYKVEPMEQAFTFLKFSANEIEEYRENMMHGRSPYHSLRLIPAEYGSPAKARKLDTNANTEFLSQFNLGTQGLRLPKKDIINRLYGGIDRVENSPLPLLDPVTGQSLSGRFVFPAEALSFSPNLTERGFASQADDGNFTIFEQALQRANPDVLPTQHQRKLNLYGFEGINPQRFGTNIQPEGIIYGDLDESQVHQLNDNPLHLYDISQASRLLNPLVDARAELGDMRENTRKRIQRAGQALMMAGVPPILMDPENLAANKIWSMDDPRLAEPMGHGDIQFMHDPFQQWDMGSGMNTEDMHRQVTHGAMSPEQLELLDHELIFASEPMEIAMRLLKMPQEAKDYATQIHEGQMYGEQPYMNHVEDVASGFDDPHLQRIAYLHDTIEDSETGIGEIHERFGENVGHAVDALTRRQGEQYFDYINRVKEHPEATQVKLADLHSNLKNNPNESLARRYQKAIGILTNKSEPMEIAMRLLKERVSPEAKRHKLEYDKKYESSPERVKYREDLNRERRRRHIMGQGGPDMSHTSQHTIVPEDPHTNRARHFKDKGTLL